MSAYRFSVDYDSPRNILFLAQEGSAEQADLERFRDAYVRALAGVRPGWVLVHDQGGVKAFTDGALEVGKDLVEITNRHEPAAVIRIAPQGLASRSRVTRVLVTAKSRYKQLLATSREEAERMVAGVRAGTA